MRTKTRIALRFTEQGEAVRVSKKSGQVPAVVSVGKVPVSLQCQSLFVLDLFVFLGWKKDRLFSLLRSVATKRSSCKFVLP